MRVFLTGATGFIGSAIIDELTAAGHEVAGLARSDEGEAKLAERGVTALRGDVAEPERLAEFARAHDGVIHCAYDHDFTNYLKSGEIELAVVAVMTEALAGTGKPFVIASGMTAGALGRPATEADPADLEGWTAVRGRPEAMALAAAAENVRSAAVRLSPSVHDRERQGLVPMMIQAARAKGVSAYVGDGSNRWPAVHRRDAARLFRLGLERAEPGQRLHAVGEEGVPIRAIAEAIGERLGVPARSIAPEDAAEHFGWIGFIVAADIPATAAATCESLGWTPTWPGLLEGLRGDYVV
ncbi:SDR family oxidoreductase [Phenylobacterium sp.]|uniref:SDR family oxidoreductase n=1 Tax=Phenylobacterium sp. TaxID=1871053 RepID=UPI0035B4F01C